MVPRPLNCENFEYADMEGDQYHRHERGVNTKYCEFFLVPKTYMYIVYLRFFLGYFRDRKCHSALRILLSAVGTFSSA